MSNLLPKTLAFVDLETSGSSGSSDRIIEIGIIKAVNNRIVKKFQTLVNPQTHLSEFISDMTGIQAKDLDHAPTFRQIQDEVRDILSDAVFVAHNVRFDYGFLRQEFRRLDTSFSAKQICTVKLFRLLHPELRHHNLDSLIEYYNFDCQNRHRAFDDAKVLWDFYKIIQKKYPLEIVEHHVSSLLKNPTLPPNLASIQVDQLPEDPGVYMFYGDDGSPLYVGKSVNIRDRVLSHFSNDKEIKISQAVKSMETIKTDSELEALILEANLVKSKQPIFNRQLRNKLQFSLIRQTTDENGYSIATIETVKTIDDTDNILAICKSTKEAKTLLKNKIDDFGLCAKLLNLEKTNGACFSCQINKCKGACIGKENPGIYNVRFLQAFEKSKIKNWPFKGSVVIHNKLIVNKWKLGDGAFDWDTYKILARFIFDIKNQKYIKSFENVEFLEATPS